MNDRQRPKAKKTIRAKRMKLHGSGYSRHLHQAVIHEEAECEQS